MIITRYFRIILVLLLSLFSLSGCLATDGSNNFYATPEVSITSIVPKSYDGNNISFDIGLAVKNPNLIPLPIDNISSNIKLNSIHLLSTNSAVSQSIPANGTGQITVNANTDVASIQKLLQSLRSTTVDYQVNGQVGIANFTTLPFNQTGKIDTIELASKLLNYQQLP